MTIYKALQWARSSLKNAGVASFETESFQLLEALLGLTKSELLLRRQSYLSAQERAQLGVWLARRRTGEPLQHILGFSYFYGLKLIVTPEVLIPRPETERLVELCLDWLRMFREPRILDIGTGSGAIALALIQERPDASVMATDVSEAALDIARTNAARLALPVTFAQADLLQTLQVGAYARGADLLVSNPPYLLERDRDMLSPEVRHDPASALFSGEDGLNHFKRLERESFALLKPGAAFFCELDPRNIKAAYVLASRWSKREKAKDLLGRSRFLLLYK